MTVPLSAHARACALLHNKGRVPKPGRGEVERPGPKRALLEEGVEHARIDFWGEVRERGGQSLEGADGCSGGGGK